MFLLDFFLKEDVYLGYSLEELSKVRGALEREGIKYSYKTINPSGQWSGRRGSRRGYFGSMGMNMKYEIQYVVSVNKKDYERAAHLVNRALHT